MSDKNGLRDKSTGVFQSGEPEQRAITQDKLSRMKNKVN